MNSNLFTATVSKLAQRFLIFVLSISVGTAAWAQVGAGSISGIVQDPTSAVVPGADAQVAVLACSADYAEWPAAALV